MLKYKCLLCGIEWGDSQASESEISHGYCPDCIRERYTEKIHEAQLRAGYSDCFNRGYNDCSELGCCFRSACQDYSVVKWRKRLLDAVDTQDMADCR
jgi:radical SAM superfamily enzyme